MPSLTESPVTHATTTAPADLAPRLGSYITLPGGRGVSAGAEGSYVTVPGNRNAGPVTRGSYVTVPGGPAVSGSAIQGSYVTLPTAA